MRDIYRLSASLCFILFFCTSVTGKGTDKELIRANLATTAYPIDSEASAVVLFENTTIEITEDHFVYSKKEIVHKIIKILKADAIQPGEGNVADVHIYYPRNDMENFVYNVKATTYNQGEGGMVEHSLAAADIYKGKTENNVFEVNFSLPSVKEGSVIEYSYEKVSQFNEWLLTWEIQQHYPKLVSEFKISYPDKFEFTSIANIRFPQKEYPSEEDAQAGPDNFCHVKDRAFDGHARYSSYWIRKNVPVVKEEPFIVNYKNLRERIELQMTGYMSAEGPVHYGNSWDKVNTELWKKGFIGKEIGRGNKFLDNIIDSLTRNKPTALEKTKTIYSYVRGNFRCNRNKSLSSMRSLNTVFEDREGNIFEINMLLTAMLVHADIDASPVIMSTTDMLSLTKAFPVLDRFNYLIATVKIDSDQYCLDATDKSFHFGDLPPYCYNGYAWVLGNDPYGISLDPDLLLDKSVYVVKVSDFTDTTVRMEVTAKLGNVTSSSLRRKWAEDEQQKQVFLDGFSRSFARGISSLTKSVSNVENADTNIIAQCSFKIRRGSNTNEFFMNAIIARYAESNPYRVMDRKLPVELPYRTQYNYYMNIILPPGIEPDSVSKPVRLNYDDDKMVFKKILGYYPEMHTLTVNASYEVNTTLYPGEEYGTISTFFQKMLEESNEIISFKKTGSK